MRRLFKWDKKYLYWGITAFCVIACAILFYMALNYLGVVGRALKTLAKILSPFIWGLVLCYLLAPLAKSLQNKLFDPLTRKLYRKNKRKDGSRLSRSLSVVLSEIIMLAVIAALVYLIIPQLYSSIETIVTNSPVYFDNLTRMIERILQDYPEVETYVTDAVGDMNEGIVSWLQTTVLPKLGNLITNVGTGVYIVLMGIYNLVVGIIVSVYLLGNRETFSANARRILYSILTVEAAKKFLEGLEFTDKTFMGFINGKLLDSAIIGIICYIVCAILDMPYALLVSVIVGVTNIIPFFGPFIGAIPSSLIILMSDPIKCLIFVVFIIILQQIDGNIIGPKILGSSIGINGFWVMFSIILGAGLFGFWGMLLGVPVFVVIYTLINKRIEKKLRRSDLPWETEDYIDVEYIDPVTLRPVHTIKQDSEEFDTAE